MVEEWKTTKLREEILNRIEKLIKSPVGKKLGITNASQFVDMAVREMLDDIALKRFDIINHHENLIRVLDNEIGPRGDIVELRIRGHLLICSHCELSDCVHIKYAWSDPRTATDLKNAGLRSPF